MPDGPRLWCALCMDLTGAAHDLRTHLGDFLDRKRPDGVFHVQPGGPGSVPALADL